MSKEIGTIHHTGPQGVELQILQLEGGKLGRMIQLTQGLGRALPPRDSAPGFIQLTRADVVALVEVLDGWLYRLEDGDDK